MALAENRRRHVSALRRYRVVHTSAATSRARSRDSEFWRVSINEYPNEHDQNPPHCRRAGNGRIVQLRSGTCCAQGRPCSVGTRHHHSADARRSEADACEETSHSPNEAHHPSCQGDWVYNPLSLASHADAPPSVGPGKPTGQNKSPVLRITLSAWLPLTAAAALFVSGCAVEKARPSLPHLVVTPWPVVYAPTAHAAVVSVYIDPPLFQPQPIAVAWAPPPMLVDVPVPMPFLGAIWTGGYWAWQGNWVWAAGRWAAPPQLGFGWVQPYYEHRDSVVIFIGGHWAAPGVVFVAPPLTLNIVVVSAAPGVLPGPRPIGPAGVFVPAPPGSRPGIIVPAPVGTASAVMMSAPPVTNVGMHVRTTVNNTTVNDTRITNITNTSNITSVSVVAPAEAMVSGHAYQATMPAQAHLAAVLPPVLHVAAPVPVSTRPLAAFVPGQAPAALPPTQAVRNMAGTATALPALSAPPARAQPVAGVAPSPVAAKVSERPSEPTPSAAAQPPKPVQPAVHDDAKADQQRQMLAAAKASTQRAEAEKTAHQLANAKAEAEQAARLRKTKGDAERRERGER